MHEQPRRKDFFISYNKADRAWAEWIAWQLEAAGYTTVVQAWDFRPGGNFVLDMQRAAEQAERTIAVLSPDYLSSSFTQPEWAAAFAQDPTGAKGTLLPVRVRECEPAGLLPQIVYIDLVGLQQLAARNALLEGIKRGRAKPVTEPHFPAGQARAVSDEPRFPGSLPSVWNIPHLRNPNFTGREELLAHLQQALSSGRPAARRHRPRHHHPARPELGRRRTSPASPRPPARQSNRVPSPTNLPDRRRRGRRAGRSARLPPARARTGRRLRRDHRPAPRRIRAPLRTTPPATPPTRHALQRLPSHRRHHLGHLLRLGPEHPSVAIRLSKPGVILRRQSDLEGALTCYQRALAINETVYGANHPAVAIRLNNIGVVLSLKGDLAGARLHIERALRIDEAEYGKEHPRVASDIHNLACVLEKQGDLQGARGHFERALDIFKRFLGEDHPNTVLVQNTLVALEKRDA